MANTKKLIQAAAGSGGGEIVNFEDVFSITLYEGNQTYNRVIDTGIDFVENEGLVWIKQRNTSGNHFLVDTIRGVGSGTVAVYTNSIANSNPLNGYFNSFETNGIEIDANSDINGNNDSFACYSFRQHEKFFDVVQYTGTGSTQNISHSLNDEVGFMFIKRIGANSEGTCYHRSLGATKYLAITSSNIEATSSTRFNNTAPTTTQFTVGSDSNVNASGGTYIAYLWAHNDGTGIFGPDGDHDVVKCGTYTGNGSSGDFDINVGFEPQWLLIKKADNAAADWWLFDTQRGTANRIGSSAEDSEYFEVNTNDLARGTGPLLGLHRTDGFRLNSTQSNVNYPSGSKYIYVAIRKTLHEEPENVGDVFSMITRTSTTPCYVTGFPVDFYVQRDSNTVNYRFGDRSTNGCDFSLSTGLFQQQDSGIENRQWDYQNGVGDVNSASTSKRMAAFKRARGFFDMVDYQATGTAQDIEHSLGVAPELLFVKARDESGQFAVWSTGLTGSQYMIQGSNDGYRTGANYWDSTVPTATSFRVGTEDYTNKANGDFVAYMFASNEFQKIGTYTGNGATNQDIDLGFSNGVDWLMIKRIDNSGNWFTFDSTRGIVSGNELYFQLNGNSNSSNFDLVDPYSAGFSAVKGVVSLNDSGATYLYWAIAA